MDHLDLRPKLRACGIGACLFLLVLCLLATAALAPVSQPAATAARDYLDPLPQDTGPSGLKQAVRRLANTGRLMMVTAHPDDEDGGVLTLEARGKGVNVLLLCLTRGEGGQNELGTGLSDKLGILRTLELLASDRYYGVEQRFSRVADFGYSKTASETFQKWGGHDVPLADIVRVIRTFNPDVLVARFSGTDRDGHGHHQASSILAREAFRAAADPARFPEQIHEGLAPWQAKKLYIGNVCGFGTNSCADENWTVKLDRGEVDSVLGTSYIQFAANGLAHQRSQGHGEYTVPPGPRYSFYRLVDSVLPATTNAQGHEKDFFDGIDTSLPALASKLGDEEADVPWLKTTLKEAAGHVSESVDSLSTLIRELDSLRQRIDETELPAPTKTRLEGWVADKAAQAQHALNLALNLTLEVDVMPAGGPSAPVPPEKDALTAVSPGQKFEIVAKLHNGSKYWISIQEASFDQHHDWVKRVHADRTSVGPGEDYYANFLIQVPSDAPLTRPYWSRDNPETEAVTQVDPKYQTLPLPPDTLRVRVDYELTARRGPHSPAPDFLRKRSSEYRGGTIEGKLQAAFADQRGEIRKTAVAITPAFSLRLEPAEKVIPVSNGHTNLVKVNVSSNLSGAPSGKLHLILPSGWRAEPESAMVALDKRGDERDFEFRVYPQNLREQRAEIKAVLNANGNSYQDGYTLVSRDDLGSFYYYQPAIEHVSIVDVKVPKSLKVGYVMGAGDDIPPVLQQIGMDVSVIPPAQLGLEDLSRYGTLVLGVRAYDAQKDVVSNHEKLLEYVSAGGTLLVQHNNDIGDFNGGHFTPYPAELSRVRVSVEEAPVSILAPGDPIFHTPNEISEKDFEGWVQERGLYFMDKWDEHFRPLLACHDPNEPEQKGGLLVAKYGKGTYIYTGYAFFRQIPAGVPGALRLFVNLVSAGRD